jgi:hypothetical protein
MLIPTNLGESANLPPDLPYNWLYETSFRLHNHFLIILDPVFQVGCFSPNKLHNPHKLLCVVIFRGVVDLCLMFVIMSTKTVLVKRWLA